MTDTAAFIADDIVHVQWTGATVREALPAPADAQQVGDVVVPTLSDWVRRRSWGSVSASPMVVVAWRGGMRQWVDPARLVRCDDQGRARARREPAPYVIPARAVTGLRGLTPIGRTVTDLVDEYHTCEAATEHNRRDGGGATDAQGEVDTLTASILVTLRAAGHGRLAEALGSESEARQRLRDGLADPHGEGLDDALFDVQTHRRAVTSLVRHAEVEACVCVTSCDEDPATACSRSGWPHTHADDGSGVMGRCPVHPDVEHTE